MSIRHKLLMFIPLLLALPVLAWMTVQATEAQFRAVEGASLAARADTAAATMPAGVNAILDTRHGQAMPAPALASVFRADGYFEEWGELPPLTTAEYEEFSASLRAASTEERLLLSLELFNAGPASSLVVIASGNRGLLRFSLPVLTEGSVRAFSAGGQQIAGVVREYADDRRVVEFSIPSSLVAEGLRLEVGDGGMPPLQSRQLHFPASDSFYVVARPDESLRDWLQQVRPGQGQARLVLNDRVLVNAGELETRANTLEQFLYRWVFEDLPDLPVATAWQFSDTGSATQDRSMPSWPPGPHLQWYSSASGTPVMQVTQSLGKDLILVLQAPARATLDTINTVWLQLIMGSMLVLALFVLGLLLFSSRLVSRIRSLSQAATQAARDPRQDAILPHTRARDEIGELARAHSRLMGSVKDYARYLDSLAGRLSHELRTPLAITRSSLDNLEAADQADWAPYLQRARQGLDRQADLIRALTEASRLEQALTEGEFEQVDFTALLDQYLGSLRSAHADVRLETDLPLQPVWVSAQPERLVQLLDKLFDNALSFLEPGGLLSCALAETAEGVTLSIFNEGPPLPEGDSRQLFDSLVSHRPGGGRHLGLGLYVARLIVNSHRGSIHAENRNKGVLFIVTLPTTAV